MFNNLLALSGDELHNQAGKFHYLSGGQISVPMVIRTASWMQAVSGPHHCGLLDAWMMNSPGLKVVAPATPADAKGLLRASIRDPNPVVFLEHSALYFSEGPVPEGDYMSRSASPMSNVRTGRHSGHLRRAGAGGAGRGRGTGRRRASMSRWSICAP